MDSLALFVVVVVSAVLIGAVVVVWLALRLSPQDPIGQIGQSRTEREQLEDRIAARFAALDAAWGDALDPQIRSQVIEALVRDELAREAGIDPAAAEAMSLIRQHGLRQARKLSQDLTVFRTLGMVRDPRIRKELQERHVRVGRYVEEYRSLLPWWRRLLNIESPTVQSELMPTRSLADGGGTADSAAPRRTSG